MATLREYYAKDGDKTLRVSREWQFQPPGGPICTVTATLHLDSEANASYVSFYIPTAPGIQSPSRLVLSHLSDVLSLATSAGVTCGLGDQTISSLDTATFTGRIFIYSEDAVLESDAKGINEEASRFGHSVVIRSQEYAAARSRFEVPLAFISHDHRDKSEFARPIALALQRLMCPVWFDEYSLEVGQSLRESIEKGLKECKKCVFLITPNFLANGGWPNAEYDSIFTRELVEGQKVILPVWRNVSKQSVYDYSPILADRVAVIWDGDIEAVAHQLFRAVA